MMEAHNRMLRLFLLRHGETADNRQMRYLGIRDAALTENGILQASRAAEALSQLPIEIVITSPLRRAVDTASKIQVACGIELRLESRLAEGSFGSWEGLTRADVLVSMPSISHTGNRIPAVPLPEENPWKVFECASLIWWKN